MIGAMNRAQLIQIIIPGRQIPKVATRRKSTAGKMQRQDTKRKPTTALDTTSVLVHALDPLAFGHAVARLRRIETHISWIILTGEYAYKIKKPVDFGFLDFSTLAKRRHYCLEELRLNRRFAPQIYLDVIEIHGSPEAPRLHGEGDVIEYAVKMIEFSQECLLSHHAAAGTLNAAMIDAMVVRVGDLHADADAAAMDSDFGSASSVQHWSEENLEQLDARVPADLMPASFARLHRWYRQLEWLPARLEQRRRDGRVRECHGDLHLGNMALIDGEVVPFDCIEFNPELRWIDTISEAAFIAMDLQASGYPGYCWRFISRYLESSADYDALGLLRYYVVYRALVRAKVEALRVEPAAARADAAFARAFAYLDLAEQWASARDAGMILMHGLSGSGKSTVAAQLVEALGAIQLRSDVVRKQLFDLAADADSGSATDQGIYSKNATESTYRRLRELAAQIVAADFRVVVDATFLLESQRRVLLELAEAAACPCVVVDCEAPLAELRRRISEREHDPSEANLQVLERQIQKRQPPGTTESGISAIVTLGAEGLGDAQVDQIRRLLISSPSTGRR
jgi:hypothetical protein